MTFLLVLYLDKSRLDLDHIILPISETEIFEDNSKESISKLLTDRLDTDCKYSKRQ